MYFRHVNPMKPRNMVSRRKVGSFSVLTDHGAWYSRPTYNTSI